MSKHVVMPKSDWQAILDAVRTKMQSSDLIKSGELAAIISTFNMVGGQLKAVASGTFTVASTSTAQTINHGLGEIPNFFVVMADKLDLSQDYDNRLVDYVAAVYMGAGTTSSCGTYGFGLGYSNITSTDVKTVHRDDSTSVPSGGIKLSQVLTAEQITPLGHGYYAAGHTYHWIAGVVNRAE